MCVGVCGGPQNCVYMQNFSKSVSFFVWIIQTARRSWDEYEIIADAKMGMIHTHNSHPNPFFFENVLRGCARYAHIITLVMLIHKHLNVVHINTVNTLSHTNTEAYTPLKMLIWWKHNYIFFASSPCKMIRFLWYTSSNVDFYDDKVRREESKRKRSESEN